MKHFTVLLLIISLAFGCKREKISLIKGKLISYSLPYSGSIGYSTRFILANGQEAIAFFNPETYKRMDVFTLGGKYIKSISLKGLLALERHIVDIAAINRDSFLALGKYHNNIYLFNSEGRVLRQTHISDSVSGVDANWYTELNSNIGSDFILNDSTVLLHSTYYERETDPALSKGAHLLKWHHTNLTLPYFLAVSNVFSADPKLNYAMPNFYSRFLSDSCTNVEGKMYTITPENILLFSWYCDSLYVINRKNYAIEKAIQIHSEYSRLGTPVTIDSLDALNDNLQTNGSISKAFCDPYRNLYYVAVRHGIARNSSREQRRHNRKWSLLVYNENFKFLEEVNIDPKYYPGEMLITKEGIMLNLDDYEKPKAPTQFQLFYVHQN